MGVKSFQPEVCLANNLEDRKSDWLQQFERNRPVDKVGKVERPARKLGQLVRWTD